MKKKEKEKAANEKNKKFKKIFIGLSAVIVLILATIIGGAIYKNTLENKTTGSTWTDKYYQFLKEQKEAKEVDTALKEESDISFVQSEYMTNPVMVVKNEYKEDKKEYEYVGVFGIDDDKVTFLGGYSGNDAELKLYYDIEKKIYKYYIHIHNEDSSMYTSLDTILYDYDNYSIVKYLKEKGDPKENTEEYENAVKEFNNKKNEDEKREEIFIYESDNKVEQKKLDGTTLEYNKIDEKLVDTGVEPKYFDYKKDMKNLDLREEIVEGKQDYKEIKTLVDKAIEKVVKDQIALIEKTKQDIENAKAEIKADEEKKAKEKAEKEGFKVGTYTLKYGRYEWDLAEVGDPGRKETYILRSDKTCTHTDYEGKTTNCTFKAGRATDGQSIESMVERDALIIHESNGYQRSYFPKNGGFRDTDLENFLYKGAN